MSNPHDGRHEEREPTDGLHDELSALLDDEVSPEDREALEHRLREDGALAAELTRVAEARSALRDLPEVEPPPGALEEVVAAVRAIEIGERRARRTRFAGVGVAAVAALWVAIASQVTIAGATVAPDLDAAVDVHGAMVVAVDRDRPPGLRSTHFVGGGEVVHRMLLDASGEPVSVFTQPGRLDWDRLEAGETRTVGGEKVWEGSRESEVVVVLERNGVIVVLVSGASMLDDDIVLDEVDRASATGGVQDQTWLDRLGELVGLG